MMNAIHLKFKKTVTWSLDCTVHNVKFMYIVIIITNS